MEILKENSAYLSNYEVLEILKGIKGNKSQKSSTQLATITYQTVRYLEETPCNKQNPEKIRGFLKAVECFNLTKCEKLTLINLCPKTPIEIQLVIEESEDRLSEEQIESLLQVISTHLGDPEELEEAAGEGE